MLDEFALAWIGQIDAQRLAELSAKIEKLYLEAGVESPSLDEAMVRAGVPPTQRGQARKILQLLLDNRKLVRVQGDMFMHAQTIETLKTKLQNYAAQHEPGRLNKPRKNKRPPATRATGTGAPPFTPAPASATSSRRLPPRSRVRS